MQIEGWDRVERCLERLIPHVAVADVALAGGVAIVAHLGMGRDRIGDIDFVASRMDAIKPTVAREFLVSHYHVAQPGVPKAIVQVVDPDTRLRIEFFPDLGSVVPRAQPVGALPFSALSPDDILQHKLQLLRKPVDPKHWRDADLLARHCGVSSPPLPDDGIVDIYSQDLDAPCDRCDLSRTPGFELAPKQAIFEILGYV